MMCFFFPTYYLSYKQANHILCGDVCFLVLTASHRSKPTTSLVTMNFFHLMTNTPLSHCIFGISILAKPQEF